MNPTGVLTVYQILINQCRDMKATPVKSICIYNVITPKKKKKERKNILYLCASPKIHSRKIHLTKLTPGTSSAFTWHRQCALKSTRGWQWDKDQSLKKRMKTIQELDVILPIVQMTPSELTCCLSASLTQSALSENSVWLFCSEGTGNSSAVCPIGYLDNISTTEHWAHASRSHTHTPDEKVTKAGILLCSHQQQRDMHKQQQQKDNSGYGILQGSGRKQPVFTTVRRNQVMRSLDKLQSPVYPPCRPLSLAASSQFFPLVKK